MERREFLGVLGLGAVTGVVPRRQVDAATERAAHARIKARSLDKAVGPRVTPGRMTGESVSVPKDGIIYLADGRTLGVEKWSVHCNDSHDPVLIEAVCDIARKNGDLATTTVLDPSDLVFPENGVDLGDKRQLWFQSWRPVLAVDEKVRVTFDAIIAVSK